MPFSREDLKNTFSDGQTPSGLDFANLLDAYYHKEEDPVGVEGISVESASLETDRPLSVAFELNLKDESNSTKGSLRIEENGSLALSSANDGSAPAPGLAIKEEGHIGLTAEGKFQINKSLSVDDYKGPELEFSRAFGDNVNAYGPKQLINLRTELLRGDPNIGHRGKLTITCYYQPEAANDDTPAIQDVLTVQAAAIRRNSDDVGPPLLYSNPAVEINGDLTMTKGVAKKPGGGPWMDSSSDIRVKEEIEEFKTGLEIIKKLKPVSYKFNGKAGTPKDGKAYVGFIAQNVKKVYPAMARSYKAKLEEKDEHETDLLTVDTTHLSYLMLNAIVELEKRLSSIETKLSDNKDVKNPIKIT